MSVMTHTQAHDRDDVTEKQDRTAADVGGLTDDLQGSKHEVQSNYCETSDEHQQCSRSRRAGSAGHQHSVSATLA